MESASVIDRWFIYNISSGTLVNMEKIEIVLNS